MNPDAPQPDAQPAGIPNLPGIQGAVQAMKKAGNSDDKIVDRLIGQKDLDPGVKDILINAKFDGQHSKAIKDLLAIPSTGPLVTKGSLQSSYDQNAPAALKFGTTLLGGEKVGRYLGNETAYALNYGGYRDNINKASSAGVIDEGQRQLLKTGGVSGTEALGDAAVVGSNLALPAIGDKLGLSMVSKAAAPTATFSERVLNPVIRSSLVGAGTAAAGNIAQGGDASSAIQAAKGGALFGAALPVAGRILSGVGHIAEELPDKAYTSTFGATKTEMAKAANAIAAGRETPETAALWAKRIGISGPPEKMAADIATIRNDAGSQLSKVARQQSGTVNLKEPKFYASVVKAITEGHDSQLNPEAAKEGRDILKFLKVNKEGELDANQSLKLRQFIDDARIKSSFKVNPNLNEKQDAFRKAADQIRGQISKTWPELADTLHTYAQATNAFDQIVGVAAKKANANVLSHYDALAGATAALGHPGVAIPADLALRISRDPALMTAGAQKLQRGLDAGENLANASVTGPRNLSKYTFGVMPDNANLGTVKANTRQFGRVVNRNSLRLLTQGGQSPGPETTTP
jgi:hypothetical protein